MEKNLLYYGDNVDVLRRHIKDGRVDLAYIDPPFNSNATYNVLFAARKRTQAVRSRRSKTRGAGTTIIAAERQNWRQPFTSIPRWSQRCMVLVCHPNSDLRSGRRTKVRTRA